MATRPSAATTTRARRKRVRAAFRDTSTPPARYKLLPELVPKPLWGLSAKKKLGRSQWDRIRRQVLEDAEHACQICGDVPSPYYGDPLICHEVWHYDDKRRIATLVALRPQCAKCDCAVHMGQSMVFGAGDKALAQLQQVNGISLHEAEALYAQAMAVWSVRSSKT